MAWGTVEAEEEVASWLAALSAVEFGHVRYYVDLLEDAGAGLGEPYTRQLRGKLRELRFRRGRSPVRITYYIATGRRIVLLTVFRKSQRHEPAEIERAELAMRRCVGAGHAKEETE